MIQNAWYDLTALSTLINRYLTWIVVYPIWHVLKSTNLYMWNQLAAYYMLLHGHEFDKLLLHGHEFDK